MVIYNAIRDTAPNIEIKNIYNYGIERSLKLNY